MTIKVKLLGNQKKMPEKLLILGGTREAYQLAEILNAKFTSEKLNFLSSLAGTTKKPNIPAGKFRTGGFGGLFGLKNFIDMFFCDAMTIIGHTQTELFIFLLHAHNNRWFGDFFASLNCIFDKIGQDANELGSVETCKQGFIWGFKNDVFLRKNIHAKPGDFDHIQ